MRETGQDPGELHPSPDATDAEAGGRPLHSVTPEERRALGCANP